MNINEQIQDIKSRNNLTVREIAELLDTSEFTVRNWFRDADSNGYRPAPTLALTCLIYALRLRSVGEDPLELGTRTSHDNPQDHESGLA